MTPGPDTASKKIVLLGMMTRIPVAGVVWQTVHYLLGLERLGYEAYYVETHARTPGMLMEREEDDSSARAAAFVDGVMRRFGFRDRWAFFALHDDNRCFGMSEVQLRRLYGEALCLINLHGGTEPRPELYATDRLVYLETDPVQLQTELHHGLQASFDFLEPHCSFFTYAENYGNPDCKLPRQDRFPFHPTRQPVIMDFWRGRGRPGDRFTTVGNWRQPWREVELDGERYSWSKHHEFMKFIDLPQRTSQPFELALSSYEPEDKRMLEEHGWQVRHALDFSVDPDQYRDYVANSRGEFTVAKDQNVRLRTGWFSDRSITYLAAGRPVISQDTGFSNVFPTGEGLFGVSTTDEILAAVEAINSDYPRHSRAAEEIAREYFAHDVVLGRLLEDVGVDLCGGKGYIVTREDTGPFPADLDLEPVSRRPTRLAPATRAHVESRPVPAHAARRWPGCTPVSIVMTCHENLLFTRMSVESVLACTEYPNHELIVVDNGSADGTREYLGELTRHNAHVRLVLNPGNAGFARACNQGLALADGDVVVLLNDDTLVTPGWLPRLIAPLRDPAVGLAGAVTNRIGNEAQVPAGYRTWGELREFAARRAAEHEGAVFDIGTVTMFCLATRRDAWERIGPLDQRFEIGLLEDDDYSRRAREAGYRLVCAEDAFVHHFGETSFGKLVSTGRYGEILEENKRRFEEKWGEPWQPYERRPDPGYEALRNRIQEIVADAVPADATVLVVSKGDPELLRLGGRAARHFPAEADGTWAGHHPADSAEAVASLEAMREAGGQFIVFPRTGMWWLEHYEGLQQHLESRYDAVVRDDVCVIFALNGRRS
jgi:GT2 family glycosyltransferase